MQNRPNPELIDEENPEWTAAMFNEAKTVAELLPDLSDFNDKTIAGFEHGWCELMRGEYHPIETLWDDIDFEN